MYHDIISYHIIYHWQDYQSFRSVPPEKNDAWEGTQAFGAPSQGGFDRQLPKVSPEWY